MRKADAAKAMDMFKGGMAPSQVDAALELVPGTTHDAVVRAWMDGGGPLAHTPTGLATKAAERGGRHGAGGRDDDRA